MFGRVIKTHGSCEGGTTPPLPPTGSLVTNLGELGVPFVTSQIADLLQSHTESSEGSLFPILAKFIDRLETNIVNMKH